MANKLAILLDEAIPDYWRAEVGFSADLDNALNRIREQGDDDGSVSGVLAEWLGKNQPCLFGRIAAKKNLVEYCIIREEDIYTSDEAVGDKIAASRLRWIQRGWRGEASAFVLVVLSDRLASAKPNGTVLEFARRLCGLYLVTDVGPDQIHLDEMFLEIPGRTSSGWKWVAGVNYFSAQGDGRWWQDHRIPAGVAFSVNSAGHFVRSSEVNSALDDLNETLGLPSDDEFGQDKVDSLGKALEMAMRTIYMASVGPSGKATWLLPANEDLDATPTCPVTLPKHLNGFDHCAYRGAYHTDVTIPSEYFRPEIERPTELPQHELDFTYLFHDTLDNPDHQRTAKGIQIRQPGNENQAIVLDRTRRMIPSEVRIGNEPLLSRALADDDQT
jgi:hypothetical protein